MAVSDQNRDRFQMIGWDRVATALATGTIAALVITKAHKAEAIEWVREQDVEHEAARRLETIRFETIRRWTIAAAVASGIAAIASVIALFR